MLSIEEIKLLIEKLEKVKKEDLQELINSNLAILKDIEMAVDANNQEEINRLDKTVDWYRIDVEKKRERPIVDDWLYRTIQSKIQTFAKHSGMYNSIEIGPGTCMFSKEFRGWRINYFLDVLSELEEKIRRRFQPAHQPLLRFYVTNRTDCSKVPKGSTNFVFSWDTFVFFTQEHIKQYLIDIFKVLIPGGHCFIQYADCHFDYDLREAQRGYWNYNTKTIMEKIIKDAGYEVIQMDQFRPGANFAIFKKPGNQNPVVYEIDRITID